MGLVGWTEPAERSGAGATTLTRVCPCGAQGVQRDVWGADPNLQAHLCTDHVVSQRLGTAVGMGDVGITVGMGDVGITMGTREVGTTVAWGTWAWQVWAPLWHRGCGHGGRGHHYGTGDVNTTMARGM